MLALGYDVEYKRSIVKRIADMGIEPSVELLRAIDDFNIAKIKFEKLEKEYLALKATIEKERK